MADEKQFDELIEMREHMTQLKEALKQQKIVTDSVLRKAMVNRSSWLGKFVRTEIWTAPILIAILTIHCIAIHMSWLPVALCAIILTASIWADSRTVTIPSGKILSLSFTELRQFLIRQKKMRTRQLLVEIILFLPWFAWYSYEMLTAMSTPEHPFDSTHFATTLILGIPAALIATIIIYRKIEKTNKALLADMDDAE